MNHVITLNNGIRLHTSDLPVECTEIDLSVSVALRFSLATLCRLFINIHHDTMIQHPGKTVLLPFEQLRVRDIVIYRYFTEMLAKADMSYIKVRTDNVQRPDSREAIEGPLYTHCADCYKAGLKHKRCSGCLVAYYCSVECQKKGWTLHKTECKERQNEQKEWDAALAIIDAVRTSRPQTS
ncbi:hypothetical protein P389DRAFT_5134 [Cystobasidium minutum MCA 4210]|uniref:uncharacterized protein n=1 Tax=Cystobasidium minutum MCA 4210 TaxID=1397322 RepID=UPI0034CE35B4|eukprot:jgi/Rhomi1/5134/CE5133_32